MTGVSIDTVHDDPPVRSDEAGTAPGDRRFRPDVEGLRAVAIVLVVLYHGGLKVLSGGYVGVDVFFVISGFVITGLLLRERSGTGRTSFLSFYGRRSRRIIPAASLVIVGTVIATYLVLGAIYGNPTAVDGRWTAVFLANFHFASVGTNYLDQTQPPSPLLNFWSLAVEEQFYLVYPGLFVVLAVLGRKATLRLRLGIGLVVVIVASFTLSVLQTNSDPTVAYFSPFTRAWELALGALVAVATPWLLRTPRVLSGVVTWLGLGAIAFSAVAFGAGTAYPGSLVAIPVLGAALVIAGGMSAPRWAAESVLGIAPMRWVGRISYSLYLWHWPILIIAADQAGKTSLPFGQNVFWLLLALALSVVTYTLVENPIRHARVLSRGLASIALGAVLIAATLAVSTVALNRSVGGVAGSTPSAALQQVLHNVSAAPDQRSLPANLIPSLARAPSDWGGPSVPACSPSYKQSSIPKNCVFGDPHGKKLVVMFGDSHVGMWFDAMNAIAKEAHWRFIDLWKGGCPVDSLSHYLNPLGWGTPGGNFASCGQWHRFEVRRINQLKPNLIVASQEIEPGFSVNQWHQGLVKTLAMLRIPMSRVVVLGNIPVFDQNPPECLSAHASNIQSCSAPARTFLTRYNQTESDAADSQGARYVDVTPWFCSSAKCPAVIGKYEVYTDKDHVDATYTYYLRGVLRQALGIPT